MSAEDTDLKGEDEEVSIRQPEVNIVISGHSRE
jgi:hypothetical protein